MIEENDVVFLLCERRWGRAIDTDEDGEWNVDTGQSGSPFITVCNESLLVLRPTWAQEYGTLQKERRILAIVILREERIPEEYLGPMYRTPGGDDIQKFAWKLKHKPSPEYAASGVLMKEWDLDKNRFTPPSWV